MRRSGASRLPWFQANAYRMITADAKKPRLEAGASRWSRTVRSVVVGALAVIGEIEAFPLLFHGDAQADDQVDDLVEDRRADARPCERQQHRLDLGQHLPAERIGGDRELARLGGVVRDADAAERRD